MALQNINVSILPPPTYLSAFGIKDDSIYLIHSQSQVHKFEDSKVVSPKEIKKESEGSNDTLDVTGSPLKVDLAGGECPFLSKMNIKFNLWKEAETGHVPLSLADARSYINQQYRKRTTGKTQENFPMYAVCDGNDSELTLVLGSQKTSKEFMTCKINILQNVPINNEVINLDYLEERHVLNVRKESCKINYQTMFKYYLYGTLIQGDADRYYDMDIFGSICLEMICNDKNNLNIRPSYSNNNNLVLQIIAGHPLSCINFLWKELSLLHFYLDLLRNPRNSPETKLYPNKCWNETIIQHQIDSILNSTFLEKEEPVLFDLSHIRNDNFLDKLYNILKECETLESLQSAFHYFFEELVESEVLISIPSDTASNVVLIIKGILEGKVAVPTLKPSQAMQFLFELGTEKLKQDYKAILKHFHRTSENVINSKWSKFLDKLPDCKQDRLNKIRQTVNFEGTALGANNSSKLNYLTNLHVAIDLLYLIKNKTNLKPEKFNEVAEQIIYNYVEKNIQCVFETLTVAPLLQFVTSFNVAENNLLIRQLPAFWLLKMTSTCYDNIEVETSFCLSRKPIFPPTIFDKFDSEPKQGYYAYQCDKVRRINI